MQKHWRNVIRSKGWVCVLLATGISGGAEAQTTPDRHEGPASEATSVCELLKNISYYRGRIVRVRGIYWFGLRQSCSAPLITAGHTWPSALNLVGSDLPNAADETVSFRTDWNSWDQLDLIALREARAGNSVEIWATIAGKVRAHIRRDGQVAGGYGHLGVFPAELVIEHVSNIVIKPNSQYDYRQLLRLHEGVEKRK